MKEYLAEQFIQATDDFETAQLNSVYFPLEKAVKLDATDRDYDERRNSTDLFVSKYRGFGLATAEERKSLVADFMHSLSSQNVTELSKIRSWNKVLQEDLTRSALFLLPASWRYLLADQVYEKVISNPRDWSDMVNLQPSNIGFLFKAAQELRTEHEYYKGILDKAEDLFAKSVKLPEQYQSELGFILAYRWEIQDLLRLEDGNEFSLENLVKLPADAVLAINEIYFDKINLAEKLKNTDVFADMKEGQVIPWFSLVDRYLGSEKLENEVSEYTPLVLAAPLEKMSEMIQRLEDSDLKKILTTLDLNPVRAQEIWKVLVTLDKHSELEDLFFKIGHKLDIEQINSFYDTEFVELYSHRHDLEMAWIGRTLNVPWSHVKHVATRHYPTSSINQWGTTDLLNLGRFSVGLSFTDLKAIESSAISEEIVKKMVSPSMTKGQLCILYNALVKTEAESGSLELAEEMYACLPPSQILGESKLKIKEINPLAAAGLQGLIKQSFRFNPAQKAALLSIIEDLWKPEILSTILLHNPSLLRAVSNKEFTENIVAVRDAIVEAGYQNLPIISKNIMKLPRRLLTAWLETTLVFTEFGKIDVDVLLDRPSSLRAHSTDSTEVAVNLIDHANSLDALLPSLALTGLTCDLIGKIPAGEIVEVISTLRYQLGEDSIIHSGVRKCLARGVREYMVLKSELYNIPVSGEIELLSLLSTADIRAIGAEVFLTWGGKVLSEITHPEVRKEVLQVIASDAPHIYFHNGVSYKDVQLMATTLFDQLLDDNQNVVDLGVLKKMRDLLPFLDRMVEASPADTRMWVSSVHSTTLSRGICTSMNNRNLVRNMLIKAYGNPETWTSLDLVEMGDLLITMTKSDLMEISVESVRRALPQLVDSSVYGILLPEVRGRVKPQLYYEACALWLNNGKDTDVGEGKAFIASWRKLARWHISGADQINLRNNPKVNLDRMKRQAVEDDLDIEETPDIDYRVLHDQVMKQLMSNFKDLDKEVASQAVNIISETQELLGNGSLLVMGYDPTEQFYTRTEVLERIKAFQSGDKITPAKEEELTKLALDSQVRLIQRLVALLGLDASSLGVSADSIDYVNSLQAFQRVEAYVATAKYLFEPGTEAPLASDAPVPSSGNSDIDEILIEDANKEKEIENFTNEKPEPIDLDNVTEDSNRSGEDFVAEEGTLPPPVTEPVATTAEPQPAASMQELAVLPLSCDDLKSAGRSATAINSRDIHRMVTKEFVNCIEFIGSLDFRSEDLPALWEAMHTKLKEEKSMIGGQEMANLGKLLPEVAKSTPSYLDMDDSNLEAISVLGEHSALLMNVFLEENARINLNSFELMSLGRMVCGLTSDQWSSLINKKVLEEVLVPHISSLECELPTQVAKVVHEMVEPVLDAETVVSASSSVEELDWLISLLPAERFASIPARFMDQVSPVAMHDELSLSSLSAEQLASLAPHTASFIQRNQIKNLDNEQATALLTAVGEDPVTRVEVEKVLTRLAREAAEAAAAEEEVVRREEGKAEPSPKDDSSAGVVGPVLLLVLCSAVLLL